MTITVPHGAGLPADVPGSPTTAARDGATLTVGVVGLGYVGLPTALALIQTGCTIVGVDVSATRRRAIASLDVDLLPRDLQRLATHVASDRLVLTADAGLLRGADVVVICVPTPVDEHLVPDLGALRTACATVVANARPGQLLMLTSTTYVGTTRDLLERPLADRGLVVGRDVAVAFSPERIDPGNDAFPVERTPRVVGGVTDACLVRATSFLALTAPLVHQVSSCEAAEMTKLHENTFRAVNIAYANEIADVCEVLGLDPTEVIDAAATKPYGFMAFRPGPGIGGHCIPCDPHYLLWQLRAERVQAPLVETVMQAVAARPAGMVERVQATLAERGIAPRSARVLVVGVSYKPGVADVRESPALEILERLRRSMGRVGFFDPFVPQVRLREGVLCSEENIHPEEWDVVLVHTVHPLVDLGWLLGRVPIVDATFSLPRRPVEQG